MIVRVGPPGCTEPCETAPVGEYAHASDKGNIPVQCTVKKTLMWAAWLIGTVLSTYIETALQTLMGICKKPQYIVDARGHKIKFLS